MSYPKLVSRLKTASILLLILAVVLTGSAFGGWYGWGLIIAVAVFVVVAAAELQHACLHEPLHPSKVGSWVSHACFMSSMLLPATVILLLRLDYERFVILATTERLLPFVFYMSGLALFAILLPVVFQTREEISQIERKILERILAILLVGLGGSSLLCMATIPDAPNLFIWTVAMVACNDSAAYFIGAKIKTPPVSPVLSPKKTVLGSAAGLVAGTLAGYILIFLLPPVTDIPLFLTGVVALNLIAQLGDLLTSLLKRLHGLKDLGTMLPGHGGALDRIDGLLLASPFALALLVIITQ